jgi:hypothetical protein
MLVAIVLLALSFAIPGGAGFWRALAPFLLGLLIVGALVGAILAALRPRRRR